jgi:hypothetical protein
MDLFSPMVSRRFEVAPQLSARTVAPVAPLALRAFAFATEGSVGYVIGGFARQAGEKDIGKFTLTLRKAADGRWLIVSDMDNPNEKPRRLPAQ